MLYLRLFLYTYSFSYLVFLFSLYPSFAFSVSSFLTDKSTDTAILSLTYSFSYLPISFVCPRPRPLSLSLFNSDLLSILPMQVCFIFFSSPLSRFLSLSLILIFLSLSLSLSSVHWPTLLKLQLCLFIFFLHSNFSPLSLLSHIRISYISQGL